MFENKDQYIAVSIAVIKVTKNSYKYSYGCGEAEERLALTVNW
jgi:hypothetical protein